MAVWSAWQHTLFGELTFPGICGLVWFLACMFSRYTIACLVSCMLSSGEVTIWVRLGPENRWRYTKYVKSVAPRICCVFSEGPNCGGAPDNSHMRTWTNIQGMILSRMHSYVLASIRSFWAIYIYIYIYIYCKLRLVINYLCGEFDSLAGWSKTN